MNLLNITTNVYKSESPGKFQVVSGYILYNKTFCNQLKDNSINVSYFKIPPLSNTFNILHIYDKSAE